MKKFGYVLILIFFSIISLSAAEFAEMYIVDKDYDLINSTDNSETLLANTWLQITGFSGGETSTNWSTSTADALSKSYTDGTTNGNGRYIVRYSASFKGSDGDWDLGIAVDGGAKQHIVTRRIGDHTASDVGNASGCGFINLSGTSVENIRLYIRNSVASTVFNVLQAQVVISEVKQVDSGSFGEIYYNKGVTHSGKSLPGQDIGTNSWNRLTSFTQGTNLSNVTSSSSSLTVGSAGKYLVCLSMSFWGDAGSDYRAGISIDGAEPSKSKLGRYFPGAADLGDASCFGIFDLSASQNISVEAFEATGDNFFLVHGNLSVLKLESDKDAPYASMGGASSVTVNSANTDVTISTSNVETDSGYWSFSANSLNPINLSAGYYLVNYSMSLTYTLGADLNAIYILSSVYKNNVNQQNLVAERKLQKRDGSDIGAMGGSGIIKIETTNDALTFKINNDIGQDIDISKLNIMIQRIDTISEGTLPVELSSFNAMVTSTQNVALNWTVHSETNGSGYRIYRSGLNNLDSAIMLDNFIPALNLSQTHTYSFVDSELDGSYLNIFYWIEFVELDNTSQIYGPAMVLFEHDNDNTPELVIAEGIRGAYPNPFNPDVTISYHISSPKSADFEIYNLKGQLVKVLTTGTKNEGTHEISWNGKDSLGKSVASGTYFIKPVNLLNQNTIKVMLTK